MPTKEQCQKRIFKLAIKLGVSPKLIATRLLSNEDKHDMLNGLVPDESLEPAIMIWIHNGMPDYSNGLTKPYKPSNNLPMNRYRGIGKESA